MDAGRPLWPPVWRAVVAAGDKRYRMFHERTTGGLDVHARSVVTEAVDWDTGRVFSQRLVLGDG